MTNSSHSRTLRFAACMLLCTIVLGCAQSGVLTRQQPAGPDENWDVVKRLADSKRVAMKAELRSLLTQIEAETPDLPQLKSLRERLARLDARDAWPAEFVGPAGITFVLIQPGEFLMGSPPSEAGRDADESQHRVRIPYAFYMGKYEVTDHQYRGSGSESPVAMVAWRDAVSFCNELTEKEGVVFRLPTEAEWEYACRAGTDTAYSFGEVWSEEQSRLPNAWGLCDMHGNVREWCRSLYMAYPYRGDDGREDLTAGVARVLRGGSWNDSSARVRSASRFWGFPVHRITPMNIRHYDVVNGGFRVICAPQE